MMIKFWIDVDYLIDCAEYMKNLLSYSFYIVDVGYTMFGC